MIPEKEKKNCSTIFLLPGIGHTRKNLIQYGFLGAYLDDIHHDVHHDNSLYVLFKPENIAAFSDFVEKEYKNNSLLMEDYDYRGGYVVLVYHFAEKYINEYELFMQGKYSKFSKEYISLFPVEILVYHPKYGNTSCTSLQHHVFTRSAEIKGYWERKIGQKIPDDMELWSAPDMDKEVLDISVFQS